MTDLFSLPEIAPYQTEQDALPGVACNIDPASATVIVANIKREIDLRRSPPPCCICGASSPFGFKQLYGPDVDRRYFGACSAHRETVDGIFQGALKIA